MKHIYLSIILGLLCLSCNAQQGKIMKSTNSSINPVIRINNTEDVRKYLIDDATTKKYYFIEGLAKKDVKYIVFSGEYFTISSKDFVNNIKSKKNFYLLLSQYLKKDAEIKIEGYKQGLMKVMIISKPYRYSSMIIEKDNNDEWYLKEIEFD